MKRAKAHPLARLATALAVLAIGVSALIAAPAKATTLIEICTSHGVEKILVPASDAQGMPADCGHCGHCVLAAPADIPAIHIVLPVSYGIEVAAPIASAQQVPQGARAPPRPPGQAPPLF